MWWVLHYADEMFQRCADSRAEGSDSESPDVFPWQRCPLDTAAQVHLFCSMGKFVNGDTCCEMQMVHKVKAKCVIGIILMLWCSVCVCVCDYWGSAVSRVCDSEPRGDNKVSSMSYNWVNNFKLEHRKSTMKRRKLCVEIWDISHVEVINLHWSWPRLILNQHFSYF